MAASAVGVVALLALTGCSQQTTDQLKRLGLPPAASNRSPYMSDLWIGAWIACLVTGVVVWGLIGYCIIRFRRRLKGWFRFGCWRRHGFRSRPRFRFRRRD